MWIPREPMIADRIGSLKQTRCCDPWSTALRRHNRTGQCSQLAGCIRITCVGFASFDAYTVRCCSDPECEHTPMRLPENRSSTSIELPATPNVSRIVPVKLEAPEM